MSAKREFRLLTQLGHSQGSCEAEDSLIFSREELSRDDPDGCSIGIDIDFTIDNAMRNKETDGFYEISQTSPACKVGGRTKKQVDTIHICYCFDTTDEIRDLADWLIREADEVDKEKEIMEERE